jgi:hypothetical protein
MPQSEPSKAPPASPELPRGYRRESVDIRNDPRNVERRELQSTLGWLSVTLACPNAGTKYRQESSAAQSRISPASPVPIREWPDFIEQFVGVVS